IAFLDATRDLPLHRVVDRDFLSWGDAQRRGQLDALQKADLVARLQQELERTASSLADKCHAADTIAVDQRLIPRGHFTSMGEDGKLAGGETGLPLLLANRVLVDGPVLQLAYRQNPGSQCTADAKVRQPLHHRHD